MPITLSPAGVGAAPETARLHGGRVRACLRLVAILSWTLGWFLLWGGGTLVLLPLRTTRLRCRQGAVRRWARGMSRLVGMRRQVLGLPPRAPFLLVTNHLSYLDILLLYCCLDGVFVAKLDMPSWPLLGSLAQLVGTIWLRREVRRDAIRVLELIDRAIARGDGVILFPEGTTSSGVAVMPMKPALLDWAARHQYPVHYAAISYHTPEGSPPAEAAVCWWGKMPFGKHALGVLRLPHFHASVAFGAEAVTAPTRGELAERLREAIAARFVPVAGTNIFGAASR